QAVDDRVAFIGAQYPGFGQHGGVGDGAADVLVIHALVEIDAGGERLHELIGGFTEASAPELVLLVTHLHAVLNNRLTGKARSITPPGRILRGGWGIRGAWVFRIHGLKEWVWRNRMSPRRRGHLCR